MTQLRTLLRNNFSLFKLRAKSNILPEIFLSKKYFLEPFIISAGRKNMATILSFVEKEHFQESVGKKVLWLHTLSWNRRVFRPTAEFNLMPIFSIFFSVFNQTFQRNNIREVSMLISKKDSRFNAICENLRAVGFEEDREKIFMFFNFSTKWREEEDIPFVVLTKQLIH